MTVWKHGTKKEKKARIQKEYEMKMKVSNHFFKNLSKTKTYVKKTGSKQVLENVQKCIGSTFDENVFERTLAVLNPGLRKRGYRAKRKVQTKKLSAENLFKLQREKRKCRALTKSFYFLHIRCWSRRLLSIFSSSFLNSSVIYRSNLVCAVNLLFLLTILSWALWDQASFQWPTTYGWTGQYCVPLLRWLMLKCLPQSVSNVLSDPSVQHFGQSWDFYVQ